MDNIVKFILNYWLWISIFMSIIWGLYGCQFTIVIPPPMKWFNKVFTCFYQFIVNFVGSFAGWCCFYILGNRYLNPDIGLNSVDLMLFFLALLGITGHLYNVIIGIANAFVRLNKLVVERLMQRR